MFLNYIYTQPVLARAVNSNPRVRGLSRGLCGIGKNGSYIGQHQVRVS